MFENCPFTPSVNKALALSHRAAQENGHTYIGTEHLMVGLLQITDRASLHFVFSGLDQAALLDRARAYLKGLNMPISCGATQKEIADKLRELANRIDPAWANW